jgi:S1-C subfamily serine protease
MGVVTAPATPGASVGAEVRSVLPGSPAGRAGIRVGDVIRKVDGKDVNEPADVSEAIADKRPGNEVEVELDRNGRSVKLDATLGKRPTQTP